MPDETNLPARDVSPARYADGPGYEVRDTNVRGVVAFLVGLVLFLVVAQVLLWGMLRLLAAEERPAGPTTLTTPPMIPEQLRVLRLREDAALGRVDAAINRLAEDGIPVMPSDRTEADMNSHSGIPATGTGLGRTAATAVGLTRTGAAT